MKTLTIHIDEELLKVIKIQAIEQDLTLREYVLRVLRSKLKEDKEKDDT